MTTSHDSVVGTARRPMPSRPVLPKPEQELVVGPAPRGSAARRPSWQARPAAPCFSRPPSRRQESSVVVKPQGPGSWWPTATCRRTRCCAPRRRGSTTCRREQIVVVHECPRCGSDEHGRPRLLPTASAPASGVRQPGPRRRPVGGRDHRRRAGRGRRRGRGRGRGFAGFADVALHPDERATPPADPTRTWVRKEALLKAYGLGLAVDPSRRRGSTTTGSSRGTSHHPPPGAVWLRDLAVPGHVVAVAVLPRDGQDMATLSVTT